MVEQHEHFMAQAVAAAATVRRSAPPNPWVGAVLVDAAGAVLAHGATSPVGGAHAEIHVLQEAKDRAKGATLYVTLEPCSHTGRTGPCADAIIASGVSRVVVGVEDPDPRVRGRGVARLREAGVEVLVGVGADDVAEQLAPYLWQRRTGRPFVTAKVAATLDGAVAMRDGSSKWITGAAAREDGHRLRADADVIIVGAGTIRSDDPELTARIPGVTRQPERIVLGVAPPTAKAQPCRSYVGPLAALLDELGSRGVLSVLVEGGPRVVSSFLAEGLVQRVAWYVAPALAGLDGSLPALASLSTNSIAELRRGRFLAVTALGEDVRLDLEVAGAEHD